jgi:hypothetical protein
MHCYPFDDTFELEGYSIVDAIPLKYHSNLVAYIEKNDLSEYYLWIKDIHEEEPIYGLQIIFKDPVNIPERRMMN